MSKFFRIIVLVLVFAVSMSTAVSAENGLDNVTTNVTTVNSTTESTHEEYVLNQIPENVNAIQEYRNRVRQGFSRMAKVNYFMTAEEANFLESLGYDVLDSGCMVKKYDDRYGNLFTYYYPVVFEGPNGIELWHITKDGNLRSTAIVGKTRSGRTSQDYGDVHFEQKREEIILNSNSFFGVLYNSLTGRVSVWEFGTLIGEHFVPEHSIYAGLSQNEGYIFRKGNDVYAVRDYGSYFEIKEVCVIAHNVEFVIATDYEADGSDEWSQPLFLMTDGTVMFYCTWYSEEGTAVDDESNLIQVRFERGFNL